MQVSLIFISGLVLANAFQYGQRLRSDLNELENNYLASVELLKESSLPEKFQDATFLSGTGYRYKTVRKLRYRRRRDVSHLDLAYLPAAKPKVVHQSPTVKFKEEEASKQLPTLPSSEYLPPVTKEKSPQVVTEAPQPVTTAEAEVATESSHPENKYLPAAPKYFPPPAVYLSPPRPEYLPPAAEIATKLPQLTTKEYLPPLDIGEDLSDIPLESSAETNDDKEIKTKVPILQSPEESSADIEEAPIETPQDSAILDMDGYHYKIPDIKPDLFTSRESTEEYLPTLEDGVVEVKGPASGDTAILQDNGYNYRRIKHRF